MKIILGGKHLPTPIGSSVSIQGSMSDAVPKCNIALYDEDSSIEIECPQEMIILDEKAIENPAYNMLQNPSLDPYTSLWLQDAPVAGITLDAVVGGGLKYTFNNAAIDAYRRNGQYTYMSTVNDGQTYKASLYAIGDSPVGFDIFFRVSFLNATGTTFVYGETHHFTVETTLTRHDFSITAPASADRGNMYVAISGYATSATNSGSVTFTQIQLEPEWFDTQSYPTPWCGPSQTDCRQLPNGLWIRQYRKFGGFVVSPSYDDYHGNVRTVHIQAVGYAWLLGTIYPSETYASTYDKAILEDLADTYLVSADPRGGTPSYTMVNTDNVVQGVQLANFIIPMDDMKTAHNNLASQIGFYWTIDAYWSLVYAPPGYYVSPYSLICDNSDIPDMTTTFPSYNFRRTDDLTQPGSNILVVGSGSNVAQVIDPVRVRELGFISGYFMPTNSSWMRKVQATELGNINDCNQRGIAELLQYSKTRSLYKLTTDACELVAGQAIAVTSNTDGLNRSSLLLQSVTARWIGTDETLHDKWEYDADLGAMNRQVQNILNRLFKKTTSSSSSPTITQTSLVIFEQIGMLDTPSTGTTSTVYQATVLDDAPLAFYRLGELFGTAANDFSGHAYTGTITGSGVVYGVTGPHPNDSSKAMTFDGSAGQVSSTVSTLPTGAGAWTVEAWIKLVSYDGARINVIAFIGTWGSNNQSGFIAVDASGNLQIATFGTNYSSAVALPTGAWHHVVGSYDGSNFMLYYDGVPILGPQAHVLALTGTGAAIANVVGATRNINATIADAAIYGSALSLYRIQQHYAVGSSEYAPLVRADAPLVYYRLDELSGTTVYDWSSNGYNGTLDGATLYQTGLLTGDNDTCMLFDGSNDYVDISASVAPTSALTLECWFKPAAYANYPRFIANDYPANNNTGIEIVLAPSGDGVFGYINVGLVGGSYSGDSFGASEPVVGTTYHFVLTWDGTTIIIYIDGSSVYSASWPIANIAGTYCYRLANNHETGDYFHGNIDEAAIYDYALSSAQVLAHYNAGV